MKTIEVKVSTREEVLAFIKELRKTKHIAQRDEAINKQIDDAVLVGRNYICLDLTELVPSETGCYAQRVEYKFLLEDFNKEHLNLMIGRMEDQSFRQHQLDCWEKIVKIEREAALRQGEHFNAMLSVGRVSYAD